MPAISSPLAQTFTVEADPEIDITGRFLSSVDVYFGAKDDNLPITMEIRNVVRTTLLVSYLYRKIIFRNI